MRADLLKLGERRLVRAQPLVAGLLAGRLFGRGALSALAALGQARFGLVDAPLGRG